MNRRRLLDLYTVMVLAMLGPGPLPAVHAEPCVRSVRWNDDPPDFYRDAAGRIEGLGADLIREALRRTGCEPRFVEMPWARALIALETGELEILFGALRTPDRERYAFFTRPVNRSPNVLFMRKDAAEQFRFQRLEDIVGTTFRLGYQARVSYGGDYDRLRELPAFAERLSAIANRRGGWKMIEAKRIDGLIADDQTAAIELQQEGLADIIVKSAVVVSADASHIALSRKAVSADWFGRFDDALRAMIADGTFKRLRERYLPCPVAADAISCR